MSDISKADFNNQVRYYISDLPRSIVSWHSGSIPTYSSSKHIYNNINYLGLRSSPPSSDARANEAFNCILNTARAHNSIRIVATGLWGDGGALHYGATAYAYLTSPYAVGIDDLATNVRNTGGIYQNYDIKRQSIINGLSGFYSQFVARINSAGTLDLRMCHTSCHSSCHGSRSRR